MGVKEYKLPNGRTAVFEYDENGVGKITLEAMDLLIGMVNIDLVRCGECVWFNNFEGCIFSTDALRPDDFCSYGERRTDE